MVGAFAPLKEICPDRATPELMELTRRQMQLANGFCRYLEMAMRLIRKGVARRNR
ncbi:hypothetical protein [Mesorhizobium sp. M2A.F.Ca.ET.039.01.1.1]|uniref:hypothetical protein n=1 Tax=Mesorhizobium sp. M2A.F.Ca.ET.039.01.1.1 TaxID=2496746 RepID=UPI001671CD2D|nr:hypothetical protein [Mesorhizobium sp. M2A.F.Ca.ET.039.01.1.1]